MRLHGHDDEVHDGAGRNRLTLRDMIAVEAGRAAASGSRLLGHQGTSVSGKAAMAVAPDVLADLAGQVKKTIFAVCGTNGKTTVNNLLCAMLEAEGNDVICNRLGANMSAGVTGAFLDHAGSGGLQADHACIEVDEASAVHVFPQLKPDYLILTNLFRDQLDRYGEIDITIELLEKAIRSVPDMKLIVNADDPLSVYLAEKTGNDFVCYGIHDIQGGTEPDRGGIREGRFCKKCGALLSYDRYYYGQMGIWRCQSCSFERPEPAYAAREISLSDGVAFSIGGRQVSAAFRGLYSVCNLLAAWSALSEDGHGTERFGEVLERYRPQFGRGELFSIGGCRVRLDLAKNPAGFDQNISAMLSDRDPKDVIIAINDNDQDGTDISWLWDVDFDRLRDSTVRSVTVSGIRALDMRLRLKYVGINSETAGTPEEAIENKITAGSDNLYVLVNYTALFEAHQFLRKKERKGSL